MDFLEYFNHLENSMLLAEDEGIGDNRLQCYIGNISEIRELSEEKRLFYVKSTDLKDTVPNDSNLYIRVDNNIHNIGKVDYSYISKNAEAIHRTDGMYISLSVRNSLTIGMEVFADDVPCPPTNIEHDQNYSDILYEASRSFRIERDANPFQYHSPFWRIRKPEPDENYLIHEDDEDESILAFLENINIAEHLFNCSSSSSSSASSSRASSPTSSSAAAAAIVKAATSSQFNFEPSSSSSSSSSAPVAGTSKME